MTTMPLSINATVLLDASGNGTAKIGPTGAREVWRPSSVHVTVNTSVNEATCDIYVGDAAQQRCFRDSTFTGSSGDSTDRVASDIVKASHYVWAVWTGGDPKAQATLVVTGTKDV